MRSSQFIQWQDLFVTVDDGSTPLSRYDAFEIAMQEQAKAFPQGIACLVILPPGAKPPPDDVKRCVKDQLTRMASSLLCLAYVIEGSGFKAVAARAALVSMKIFASRPYPIYVETSMHEALHKVVPHLAKVKNLAPDVKAIMKAIADTRKTWVMPPPEASHAGDMTAK